MIKKDKLLLVGLVIVALCSTTLTGCIETSGTTVEESIGPQFIRNPDGTISFNPDMFGENLIYDGYNLSAVDMVGSGGGAGNPFDQDLNQDDNVNFNILTIDQLNTPYNQTLTVAGHGGDFTSIQSAIDSITDATTTNRYCIKVKSGVYTENVICKDYVDVIGSGRTNTIINGTSGTVLTFPANKSTISELGIVVDYGTLTVASTAITSAGADSVLKDCDITVTKSGGDFVMNGMEITAGSFRMSDCYFNYSDTSGATDTGLTQSAVVQTGTLTDVIMNNNEIVVTTTDTNDHLVGFETTATVTGTCLVANNVIYIDADGDGASATGIWAYGTCSGAIFNQNRITVNCSASAYGFWIDSTAGGAVIDTRHNEIIVTSVGVAVGADVAVGDTWNSVFDKITASTTYDGLGTITFVSSPIDGDFEVTGTIESTDATFTDDITVDGRVLDTTDFNAWDAAVAGLDGNIVNGSIWNTNGKNWTVDGTDDHVQIQAAIDDLTTGGTVWLPSGILDVSTVISLDDNIKLRGMGQNVTILKASDGATFATGLLYALGKENVTISGLTIDGNDRGSASGNCLYISTGCKNIWIDHVDVYDGSAAGIRCSLADDIHISYGLLQVNTGSNQALSLAQTDHLDVSHMTLINPSLQGLDMSSCDNSVFSDIIIKDSSHGMKIAGSVSVSDNITLTNFNIHDISSAGEGFRIENCNHIKISNFELSNIPSGNGVTIYSTANDVSISHTTILDVGLKGVSMVNGAGPTNITFSDVLIDNAGSNGVFILGKDITLDKVNVFHSTSYNKIDDGSSNILIDNSKFSYGGSMGLSIDDTAHFKITNSIFEGNTGDGIDTTIAACNNYSIIDCTFKNNAGGVDCHASDDWNIITLNSFIDDTLDDHSLTKGFIENNMGDDV